MHMPVTGKGGPGYCKRRMVDVWLRVHVLWCDAGGKEGDQPIVVWHRNKSAVCEGQASPILPVLLASRRNTWDSSFCSNCSLVGA